MEVSLLTWWPSENCIRIVNVHIFGADFLKQCIIIPSTKGEGSLIILGRIPVAEGRSLLCDIKISLGLLHCERSGSLDLGEIYQCHPSECCAFNLRILTFAYSLRERPLGTSEQRIWNWGDPALWGFPVGFP